MKKSITQDAVIASAVALGALLSGCSAATSDFDDDAEVMESAEDELREGTSAAAVDQTDPTSVNNRVTCPICVCDFEDGEDVRVLPCDGRHRTVRPGCGHP